METEYAWSDSYQAYLLTERKLCSGSVENHVAALRFFFVRTLHRHEFREFLPYPKTRKKLPNILSQEEIARLINASTSLFQRTLLMVLTEPACVAPSSPGSRSPTSTASA
jgi:integrase/recombinase XerD